jgi:hypothetical protein
MEVKTFTYERTIRGYLLQGWFSGEKMDDHIAGMVTDGWRVLSQNPIPDGMTITFTRG